MTEIHAAIFDYGRTLYDPTQDALFPHAFEVLDYLKSLKLGLGLVSIALTENVSIRLNDLKRLGLDVYFDEVEIIERRGAEKDFTGMIEKFNVSPQDIIVIGDNLKREITAGNRIGAYTVWTKECLLGNFEPRKGYPLEHPDETIFQIGELIPLVEKRLI